MTVSRHFPFSHPAYGLVWSGGGAADNTDRPSSRAVQWPAAVGAPGFSCTVGRGPDAVVVSGCGDLDEAGGVQLGGVLADLIEGQGNGLVVVDLGSVTAIGRSAVKVLSAAAESAHRRGARVIVVNASSEVRAGLNDPGVAGGAPVTGGRLR